MNQKCHSLQLVPQFEHFIRFTSSGRRLSPSGRRITAGTIMGYQCTLKLIREFEELTGRSLHIQLLHRASLRLLKREKNYWRRFFNSFTAFMYGKKKCYDSYVATVMKIIKTFFNYLQNDKGYIIGNFHKSFRIPLRQPSPVVLSPDQLRFLILDKDFENSLTSHQKQVRDVFIFGCTTGLRVSDLMNLKKTNLITTGDKIFVRVFTQKTGSEVHIPLPAYATDIIERYRKKTGKFLLPHTAKSNLNINIKKLFKKAGWDSPLPKNRSLKGKMTELKTGNGESWPFYRHITAHTMRRTAITTLLILGVPENVVRKLSGHAPGSNEFYKYVNLAQDYVNDELVKAQDKLVNP